MPKGNKNPSPRTRFGAPDGPLPGKTSEQRQTEMRNAWLATVIQSQMLEAVAAQVDGNPGAALARIDPATLKLIKDAQDRGLGAPKAAVDHTNSDGSLRPHHGAVDDYLRSIHGKPQP